MTLDLSLLPDGGIAWLDASGEASDIVLSSRMRLARNVAGYAFPPRARDGERLRVLAQPRDHVVVDVRPPQPAASQSGLLAPQHRQGAVRREGGAVPRLGPVPRHGPPGVLADDALEIRRADELEPAVDAVTLCIARGNRQRIG